MKKRILEIKDLSFSYEDRFNVKALFNKISLTIHEGEIIFIHGSSGIGKTSLFHLIAGILKASSGEILAYNNKNLDDFRCQSLGFIFQDFKLLFNYSVFENMLLPLKFSSIPLLEHKKRVLALLKVFNLENKKDQLPAFLSGGEVQRLSIARALVKEPQLIIADEPFNNLDEQNIYKTLFLFDDLKNKKNISFLISSHFLPKGIEKYTQYKIDQQKLNIL